MDNSLIAALLESLPGWWPLAVIAPGLIVSVIFLWFTYRLSMKFGRPFIEAQQTQAVAMTEQAKSLAVLGASMHGYIERDNREHREMELTLSVIAERLERLRELPDLSRMMDTINTLVDAVNDINEHIRGCTDAQSQS